LLRSVYQSRNEAAYRNAFAAIISAELEGNPARAWAAAYEASQARIDNRTWVRQWLMPGGQVFSEAVDQSHPPAFYEERYRARVGPGASEYTAAAAMAEGARSSRPNVDLMVRAGRYLGPVGMAYGVYDSYSEISRATDTNQAIATEAGGWVGGFAGGTLGTAGAVTAAVFLGATPVGWAIVGAAVVGGIVGGVAGSMTGKYTFGTAFRWLYR